MADTPSTSGPGALSRRTDTGPAQKIRDLPDAQYGEAATYKDLQQSAPLAQQPQVSVPKSRPGARGSAPEGVVSIGAPSQRPDEPTTAGAAAGPGPGVEALGLQQPAVQQWQSARDFLASIAARNPNDAAVAYLMARLQGRY